MFEISKERFREFCVVPVDEADSLFDKLSPESSSLELDMSTVDYIMTFFDETMSYKFWKFYWKEGFVTLRDMLVSEDYQEYQKEILFDEEAILDDEAFSVTNATMVECWRDYLDQVNVPKAVFDYISGEIECTEKSHLSAGTLEDLIH